MKTLGDQFRTASVRDWLEQNKWSCSLVVGATCGCDVSRLGREIGECVNRHQRNRKGAIRAFDTEELRRLAVEPSSRDLLSSAAGRHSGPSRCDLECTVAWLASAGGAILTGQTCLDATRGLPNVFRVMISTCGHCQGDNPSMRLEPSQFNPESLVQVIADSFLDWALARDEEPPARVMPAVPEEKYDRFLALADLQR